MTGRLQLTSQGLTLHKEGERGIAVTMMKTGNCGDDLQTKSSNEVPSTVQADLVASSNML